MNVNKKPTRNAENYHELTRSVAVNIYKRVVHKKEEHQPTHMLANFLAGAAILWVISYVRYRFWFKHRFLSYKGQNDNGVYRLGSATNDNKIRLALVADWATDTEESKQIGKAVSDHEADYTIHMGDTYYVGDKKEICNNFKHGDSFWPYGKVGSFAMMGNHEMYSNGYGFFDELLPWMGLFHPNRVAQKASYFCLENEHWQIIGLDTGYRSVGIPLLELLFSKADLRPEIIKWLKEELNLENSNKGIILLTHHQYTSAFDKAYPAAGRQLAKIFGERTVLWFWGHEHRLAVYGQNKIDNKLTVYGRCIGHGGMPVSIVNLNKLRSGSDIVLVDNRPYKPVARTEVGHNGYLVLELAGYKLKVDYFDEKGLLLTEWWEYDQATKSLIGKNMERYCEDLFEFQDLQKAVK